jgi:hypothetical protein
VQNKVNYIFSDKLTLPDDNEVVRGYSAHIARPPHLVQQETRCKTLRLAPIAIHVDRDEPLKQ